MAFSDSHHTFLTYLTTKIRQVLKKIPNWITFEKVVLQLQFHSNCFYWGHQCSWTLCLSQHTYSLTIIKRPKIKSGRRGGQVVSVFAFYRWSEFKSGEYYSCFWKICVLISTKVNKRRLWFNVTRLGDFFNFGPLLKPLATIILPKSPTFLGNFSKVVKIYHFSSKIIFGQLL